MIVLNSSEVWSRWAVRSVVVAPSSRACPARNWRFAVVGAGFEEVTLLDAVPGSVKLLGRVGRQLGCLLVVS